MVIPDLHSGYGLYSRLVTKFYKIPDITGGIDICKSERTNTFFNGCFYQFTGRKCAIFKAVIGFAIEVHRGAKILNNLVLTEYSFTQRSLGAKTQEYSFTQRSKEG